MLDFKQCFSTRMDCASNIPESRDIVSQSSWSATTCSFISDDWMVDSSDETRDMWFWVRQNLLNKNYNFETLQIYRVMNL